MKRPANVLSMVDASEPRTFVQRNVQALMMFWTIKSGRTNKHVPRRGRDFAKNTAIHDPITLFGTSAPYIITPGKANTKEAKNSSNAKHTGAFIPSIVGTMSPWERDV